MTLLESTSLTPEQTAALDSYGTGQNLVLSAYAGTGKTTTILALATSDKRRGTYVAYNRAIVDDVQRELRTVAPHVQARTSHSLAYAAVGSDFRHRLNSERMSGRDVARLLGIKPLDVDVRGHTHRLSSSFLAGCVMDGIRLFCNSAADWPGPQFLPAIEAIDNPGEDDNDLSYRSTLAPALVQAWDDLSDLSGSLRFTHDCYLKLWQLSKPDIRGEVVFVDEAQDVNPVLAAVVEAQSAQLVAVGDSYQQIYAWRGAVDALAKLADRPGTNTGQLTWSFRFGPEIANIANSILQRLGADVFLEGRGGPSEVWPTDGFTLHPEANAVLCRTNAGVITTLMENLPLRRCALVGGGGDLAGFAKGYIDLTERGHSAHPELQCFGSVAELTSYVSDDPSGSDLALMVNLCQQYGPEALIEAVSLTVPEQTPDVLVISTAPRAKGRQWNSVRLGPDWSEKRFDNSPEELRLAYVAVTRARSVLDLSKAEFLL